MPPPVPFLDVSAVVAIYFRPPDLLFDELLFDDLLFDERPLGDRLREDDVDEEERLEPFFDPRLRLRLPLELPPELELDDRDRFLGSPPFELLALREVLARFGLRRGSSSSSSSSYE